MSIEKFKKHLNELVTVKIRDEDFQFKPLNTEQFVKLADIGNRIDFSNGKMDGPLMKDMIELFGSIVTNSYPEIEKDIAEQFVINNIEEFQEVVQKLSPVKSTDGRRESALNKIKELQKAQEEKSE